LSSLLIGAACLVSSAAQAQDRDVNASIISWAVTRPGTSRWAKVFTNKKLNVSILLQGTADAIRSADRDDRIGFIDIPSLVAAGKHASTVKSAVNYQKAPYCILAWSGAEYHSPKKLANLDWDKHASLCRRSGRPSWK